MKSRKASIHSIRFPLPLRERKKVRGGPGFSLMEMVVVIGLLGLIAALGLFISMDFYRGSSFFSERNIIISVLQKARSRAVNNINESPHGVRFEADKYVIFEGASCLGSGEEIAVSNNVTNSGGCIVFNQLTGQTSGATITITSDAKSSTIEINSEGRISWN